MKYKLLVDTKQVSCALLRIGQWEKLALGRKSK
jgi:hypothetical protein